jgi:hypothetical protein
MIQRLTRYAGPAATLGGALYLATFGMVYLIYELFAEHARHSFVGDHAFIHMFDTPMFVFLLVGTIGLYARQRAVFGLVGKAGFYLTAFGFGFGVVGGALIMVVGLAVGDAATMGVLDLIAHLLSHVFYALGSMLLGFATYRSGIFPKPAAVLMGIGPIWLLAMFVAGMNQSFLLLLVPVALTGLGWMWLGYALRAEVSAPKVVEPQPVVR